MSIKLTSVNVYRVTYALVINNKPDRDWEKSDERTIIAPDFMTAVQIADAIRDQVRPKSYVNRDITIRDITLLTSDVDMVDDSGNNDAH